MYKLLLKMSFLKDSLSKAMIVLVAAVFSMVLIFNNLSADINRSYIEALTKKNYDFSVQNLTWEQAQELVKKLGQDKLFSNICCTGFGPQFRLEDTKYYTKLTYGEENGEEIFSYELVEGRLPASKYEIVIDQRIKACSEYNWEIGDTIRLNLEVINPEDEGYYLDVTIVGWYEAKSDEAYYAFSGCSRELVEEVASDLGEKDFYGVLAAIPYEHLDEETYDRDLEIFIKYVEEVVGEEIRSYEVLKLEKEENGTGQIENEELYFEDDGEVTWGINGERIDMYINMENGNSEFSGFFRIISLFITVSAIFVIYSLYQISIDSKIRNYGLLMAMGIRKRDLYIQIISTSFLYLLNGGLLGSILGILTLSTLGKWVANIFAQSFSIGYDGSSMQYCGEAFLESFAMVFLSLSMATLLLLYHVRKLTPKEAISYVNVGKQKKVKNKKDGPINSKTKVIPFLAKKNVKRSSSRTINLAISFGISLSLAIIVFPILYSGKNVDVDVLNKAELCDYEFTSDELLSLDMTKESIEDLKKLKSVEKCYPCLSMVGIYTYEDTELENFITVYVYPTELMKKMLQCNECKIDTGEDGIVVLNYLEDEEIGEIKENWETEEMVLKSEEGKEYSIKVDACGLSTPYEEGGITGYSVFMDEKAAKNLPELQGGYNYVMVDVKNKTEQSLDELSEVFTKHKISVAYQDITNDVEDVKGQLIGLTTLFSVLMGCIIIFSLVNVVCVVKNNVLQRKKEMGIYIALGMTRDSIAKLLEAEIMNVLQQTIVVCLPLGGVVLFAMLGTADMFDTNMGMVAVIVMAVTVVYMWLIQRFTYFVGKQSLKGVIAEVLKTE